jgi:hypothetical protein
LEEAVFKSIEFTSDWIIDGDGDNHKEKKYAVKVKVEIIDESEYKTEPGRFAKIIEVFSRGLIKQGKKEVPLAEFKKKKPKMVSDGKVLPIIMSDIGNIKPVLLLDKAGIEVGADMVPNFKQIEKYCDELLPEILKETLSSNAVPGL